MHVTSSMQKETAQSLPFRPFYWDVVGKDDNIAINIVSGQPSIQHSSVVVKIIAVISVTAAQQATVVIKYRTRCVCHLNFATSLCVVWRNYQWRTRVSVSYNIWEVVSSLSCLRWKFFRQSCLGLILFASIFPSLISVSSWSGFVVFKYNKAKIH